MNKLTLEKTLKTEYINIPPDKTYSIANNNENNDILFNFNTTLKFEDIESEKRTKKLFNDIIIILENINYTPTLLYPRTLNKEYQLALATGGIC